MVRSAAASSADQHGIGLAVFPQEAPAAAATAGGVTGTLADVAALANHDVQQGIVGEVEDSPGERTIAPPVVLVVVSGVSSFSAEGSDYVQLALFSVVPDTVGPDAAAYGGL